MAFQSDARFMKCGICHDEYKCFQMWKSGFSPQVPDDPEAPGSASAYVSVSWMPAHAKGVKRMRICSKCELEARLKIPEADRPREDYATAPTVKKEMKRTNEGQHWVATGMHYAHPIEFVKAVETPMTQAEKSNAKMSNLPSIAPMSAVVQAARNFVGPVGAPAATDDTLSQTIHHDPQEEMQILGAMTCSLRDVGAPTILDGTYDELPLTVSAARFPASSSAEPAGMDSKDERAESQMLTATFTSTPDPVDVSGPAHPTCAAALADATGSTEARTFQMNRVHLDAGTRRESMTAQHGGLFVASCRLRDRTGAADVDVVHEAVPALYACQNEKELLENLEKGTIQVIQGRVNVRGVIRVENGVTKKYLGAIAATSLTAKISLPALHTALGLCDVTGDVVIPAPVMRVKNCPLQGMTVSSDIGEAVGVHRLLFLVQGTVESKLDVIGEVAAPSAQEQTFKVTSHKVRCLLSSEETYVTLVGYCDFHGMLTYRLDTDAALVLVSALEGSAPDSVSATIEYMKKVSVDEKNVLESSLEIEWKSVLTLGAAMDIDRKAARDDDYWNQPVTKLQRLQSEACSPQR
jgi:hypothetical protein